MAITLELREQELKKRITHPYEWGRQQNDELDSLTDFVYHIFSFEALLKEIEVRFKVDPAFKEISDYGMNRWYNFWSAKAIEHIFCSHQSVKAARDSNDRLREFRIGDLSFDHKTSTYPRGFNHDLEFGQKHPRELIEWFYTHQSQQRRKHFENRIFIVLYATDGQHWRLKAELAWLDGIIKSYLDHFDAAKLYRYKFEGKRETVADLMWAVR
jgi:hypothetical protein